MQTQDFIQPELLVAVPVLYFIGESIKKTEKVKNKYIPAILTGIGMLLALLYTIAYNGVSGMAVFTGICQGILCAGASVYANQIYKQAKEDE